MDAQEIQEQLYMHEPTRSLVVKLALLRQTLAECTNPARRAMHTEAISELVRVLYDRTGIRY